MSSFIREFHTFHSLVMQMNAIEKSAREGDYTWEAAHEKFLRYLYWLKDTKIPFNFTFQDVSFEKDIASVLECINPIAEKYKGFLEIKHALLNNEQLAFLDLRNEVKNIENSDEITIMDKLDILRDFYIPSAMQLNVGFDIDLEKIHCDDPEESFYRIMRSFSRTLDHILH